MSIVKKKKRNAQYEKEKKKVQREKQVESKDQEGEVLQTNQEDKVEDLLVTNKIDKQLETNSKDSKLVKSPQLAVKKSKKFFPVICVQIYVTFCNICFVPRNNHDIMIIHIRYAMHMAYYCSIQ